MASKTTIEWTARRDAEGNVVQQGATWNPWSGCTKVSPGCAHCYAERLFVRWGKDFSVVRRAGASFTAPLRWRAPRMIFTCSMSDFFHEAADAWRAEAWDIIRLTPRHTYQILTKRPERIAAHLPDDWGSDGYPHVWLGTSVENQRFVERVQWLVDAPARLRFLSCEPLVGSVVVPACYLRGMGGIKWMIVGGESGPDHRPLNIEHVFSLHRQCAAHGVSFFMKQDSGPRPGQRGRIPADLWIQEMPTP